MLGSGRWAREHSKAVRLPANRPVRLEDIMPKYTTADIRNIALVGHQSAGKTSLADAMLHVTGTTNRLGDVNAKTSLDQTALMCAASKGYIATAGMLLRSGAHVDDRDIYGLTALMHALCSRLRRNAVEVIRLLLGYGANVNMKSQYRETALLFAEEFGHRDAALLLRKAGAIK